MIASVIALQPSLVWKNKGSDASPASSAGSEWSFFFLPQ